AGVHVSIRPAGGAFPAPAGALSVTPVPTQPAAFALAGNGKGAVIASWYSFETNFVHNVVRAAVKPAGAASFGASEVISTPTTDCVNPGRALDQGGDGVAGLPLRGSGAPLGAAAYYNPPATPRASAAPASVTQHH